MPYYNTDNDGIYYKQSEVPPTPPAILNERAESNRRSLYATMSDPITNQISVLRDRLAYGDYDDENEITSEMKDLYDRRKSIREEIKSRYPYVEGGE